MRIAMDEQIFVVQEFGGISRQFSELAEQFITDPSLGVALEPLDAQVINHYLLDDPVLVSGLRISEASSHYSAMVRYFTHRRRHDPIDLVHNTFYLPRGLSDYPGKPKVMTVHDMIPELFPRTRRRLDLLTLKHRYFTSVDHIICVSHSTKNDLERIFGDIDTPISVVHHGVDDIFRPVQDRVPGLPDSYVLFVGHRGGYKDAQTLLTAYAAFRRDHPGTPLVFVGGGPFSRDEARELDRLGISDSIHQVSLTEGQMASAYSHATMLVFPSRYEGFGLPALEAMACGTPVILADSSALPEVGGDAALYFPPGDAIELEARMHAIAAEPGLRGTLVERGLNRARDMSWRRTAVLTADVYRQTLESFTGR